MVRKYNVISSKDNDSYTSWMIKLHTAVTVITIIYIMRGVLWSSFLHKVYLNTAPPAPLQMPNDIRNILDLSCYESLAIGACLKLDYIQSGAISNVSIDVLMNPSKNYDIIASMQEHYQNSHVQIKYQVFEDLVLDAMLKDSGAFPYDVIYSVNPSRELMEVLLQLKSISEVYIDLIYEEIQPANDVDTSKESSRRQMVQFAHSVIDNLPLNPFVEYKMLAQLLISDSLEYIDTQLYNLKDSLLHHLYGINHADADFIQSRNTQNDSNSLHETSRSNILLGKIRRQLIQIQ
ncbi:hypothetical protein MIR68_005891 [Amoeboaphelidium protococcarum]|nr:hypothetical protein MIR68_005891 [Amoeboaphelidium protococcarum]